MIELALSQAAWEWLVGIDSALAFALGVIATVLWVLWGAVFGRGGDPARVGARRRRGQETQQGGP